MKLLFDQNTSFRILKKLPEGFENSKHVSEVGLDNSQDSAIWEYSKKNNFSIVTFDADFYDISIIKGHPPKIIWIRAGNLSTTQLIETLHKNFNNISAFLNEEESADEACMEIV
jgi:predicted nuclease of predicted toxin-antitoxin system